MLNGEVVWYGLLKSLGSQPAGSLRSTDSYCRVPLSAPPLGGCTGAEGASRLVNLLKCQSRVANPTNGSLGRTASQPASRPWRASLSVVALWSVSGDLSTRGKHCLSAAREVLMSRHPTKPTLNATAALGEFGFIPYCLITFVRAWLGHASSSLQPSGSWLKKRQL